MTTITIPLSTLKIEELTLISGVTDIKIVEDNYRITISVEKDKNESISQILNKLSEFYKDFAVTESIFPVEKLSCDGCAVSAEKLLNNQPGVVTASVEFPAKSAKIYYLQNRTTPLKLKVALEQLGYELRVD